MRNVTILLVAVAVLAMAVPAQARPRVYFNHNDTSGGTWDWYADVPANSLWSSYDNNNYNECPFQADDDSWHYYPQYASPNFDASVALQNGGTITVNASASAVVFDLGKTSGAANMVVEADLTVYNCNVGNQYAYDHTSATDYRYISHTAGAIAISADLKIAYSHASAGDDYEGSGRYTISGGSLSTGTDVLLAPFGNGNDMGRGIFEVDGAGATGISIGDDYEQNARSTLAFVFGGGADPIQQIAVTDNVILNGTLDITGTADNGTYTIMTYGDTLTNGLTTVNLPTGWSVAYGDGSDDSITVTVVPEPATMVLLGIGGIGMLIRRKRA